MKQNRIGKYRGRGRGRGNRRNMRGGYQPLSI